MISNSMVAHNFAHNVKENQHSNSMFWESRNDGTRHIYSYGYHFCIAVIDPAADVVLFTTDRYSNTTAKHINDVRGALYQNNIIYVHDPEASVADNLKQYAAEIKSNFDSLKKSQTPSASLLWRLDTWPPLTPGYIQTARQTTQRPPRGSTPHAWPVILPQYNGPPPVLQRSRTAPPAWMTQASRTA